MKRIAISSALLIILMGFAIHAYGEVQTEMVQYRHGETLLEGFLAYDDGMRGKRPGVLIIHEWMGLGEYEKERAIQLAKLGYNAFALDMYGKGIRPKTPKEASAQAGIYRSNRQLMRARARAGLDQLRKHRFTDPGRVAAIGYCFGGGSVLELARSGVDISGVVCFHGNLDTPNPRDAQSIRAKVLVLHGADDPFIPKEQIEAFQEEMRAAEVDWQMALYSGAVHSFTNPASGNDISRGAAYNAVADRRSLSAMLQFFDEIFR